MATPQPFTPAERNRALTVQVSGTSTTPDAPETKEVTDPATLAMLRGMSAPSATGQSPSSNGIVEDPNKPAGREPAVNIPAPQPRTAFMGEPGSAGAIDIAGTGLRDVTDPAILRELRGEPTPEIDTNSPVSNSLRQNLSNNVSKADYAYDRAMGGLASTIALVGAPVSAIGMALEAFNIIPDEGPTKFGYTDFKRAMDKDFGVRNLPVPTDRWGNKSGVAEQLGMMGEYLGSGLIPGVGAAAVAERKLLTFVVQGLSGVMGGDAAYFGKELAENFGPTLGLGKERSGIIGSMVGGMFGSGLPMFIGQTLAKSWGGAANVAAKADLKSVGDVRKIMSNEQQRVLDNAMVQSEVLRGMETYPKSVENALLGI
ncbi:MAG: hypothetical protein K2W88_01595, partial [Pararheinheimera sp.]|nr:hypothetical protein [Rheinheimera sp.]